MSTKLRITFEKGGTIYARFLLDEAPMTCKAVMSTMPRREKILQAKIACSAIYIDSRMDLLEEENLISDNKRVGYMSLTRGASVPVGKAFHMWYDEPIYNVKNENLFAIFEEESLAQLKEIGFRVAEDGPEYALFEVVEE